MSKTTYNTGMAAAALALLSGYSIYSGGGGAWHSSGEGWRPDKVIPPHLQELEAKAKEWAVADANTRRQARREKRLRLAQKQADKKERIHHGN